jgi:hypothetical protein
MDENNGESARTQVAAFVREIGTDFGTAEELIGLISMKVVAKVQSYRKGSRICCKICIIQCTETSWNILVRCWGLKFTEQ